MAPRVAQALCAALVLPLCGAFAPMPRAFAPSPATTRLGPRGQRVQVILDPNSDPSNPQPFSAPQPPTDPAEKAYDAFLAQLIFSPNPVQNDIVDNIDEVTPEFIAWLRGKGEGSTDPDEKEALTSLADTVVDIVAKIEERMNEEAAMAPAEAEAEVVNAAAGGSAAAPATAASSPRAVKNTAEILSDMRAMQYGDASGVADDISEAQKAEKKEAERQRNRDLAAHVAGDALKSYQNLIREITEREDDMDLVAAVEINYDKCDIQFMSLLEKFSQAEAAPGNMYESILNAILSIAERRMQEAGETLQTVLKAGSPQVMQREMVVLARAGKVDEPLVLVLEANIQQAKDAGAAGPAQVLQSLLDKARVELDRKVPPEQALLRQLLRCEQSEARVELLNDAFRPRQKVAISEGAESSEEPRVAPPAFINAAKALLLNFANIDESVSLEVALRSRITAICDEAERVATGFYGASMTPREQQDRMMKDGTVSVFTLEKAEEDAANQGQQHPWQNDKYDWMDTPEALGFERMNKGGMDEMRKDIGGL